MLRWKWFNKGSNARTTTLPEIGCSAEKEAVSLGCLLREAVEQGDLSEASKVAEKRKSALVKINKWGRLGNLPGFNSCVEMALHLPEVNELSSVLTPERVKELRLAVALHYSLDFDVRDGVLATIADLPANRLAEWGRFADERSKPSYMWDNILQDDPEPKPIIKTGASLSQDARALLAYPKLLSRRMAVSREHLIKRTFLSAVRVEAALIELEREGFAAPATLLDKLATLSVRELSPLIVQSGLPKSWSKAKKLQAIEESCKKETIEGFLERFPKSLEAKVVVGVATSREVKFHFAWAVLIGHYLSFVTSSRQKQKHYLEMRAWMATWFEGIALSPDDSCTRCGTNSQIDLENFETFPPFHLGCRCCVSVIFDPDEWKTFRKR